MWCGVMGWDVVMPGVSALDGHRERRSAGVLWEVRVHRGAGISMRFGDYDHRLHPPPSGIAQCMQQASYVTELGDCAGAGVQDVQRQVLTLNIEYLNI